MWLFDFHLIPAADKSKKSLFVFTRYYVIQNRKKNTNSNKNAFGFLENSQQYLYNR